MKSSKITDDAQYMYLRPAGSFERRYIMRNALGYYRALVVAGRYKAPKDFDYRGKETFIPALKHCISVHPMLSAAIKDELSESPSLIQPATLDLSSHTILVPAITLPATTTSTHEELSAIHPHLIAAHDAQFRNTSHTPPWRLTIIPLTTPSSSPTPHAFYLLFSYLHSHGDGTSGALFHRTLLSALRDPSPNYTSVPIFPPPSSPPLLPPFEHLTPLPLTLSYLLRPVFATLLPRCLASRLGLRAAVAPSAENVWTAGRVAYDAGNHVTGLAFAAAGREVVEGLLARCRRESGRGYGDVKLTAVLHECIVRALSAELAPGVAGSFVAETALNLRAVVPGFGREGFGACVSVAYHVFPRTEGEGFGDDVWRRAAETTAHLRERAGSVVDQPVAMLKFLRGFQKYLEGRIGSERETSYELSNIMAFEPEGDAKGDGNGWTVDGMTFSQPADATGCAVNFNVVSVKGGGVVATLTWQRGALDVEGGDEEAWARRVCGRLENDMVVLAGV